MGWSLDEALRFPLRGGGYRGSKGERGVSSETQLGEKDIDKDGIPLSWRLNYVRLVCMFDYKKIRLANDHNHIHPQWAAHSLSQSLTGFPHLPDQIPSNSRIQHNIVRDRDQRQSLLQLLKLLSAFRSFRSSQATIKKGERLECVSTSKLCCCLTVCAENCRGQTVEMDHYF